NNAGFEVQYRREHEDSWSTAGFIRGSGTCREKSEYSYAFMLNDVAGLFVRVRQIDTDGSSHFSPEVYVASVPARFKVIGSFPNPAKEHSTVEFMMQEAGPVTVSLRNALGAEVIRKDYPFLEHGTHSVSMNLEGLAPGLYHCILSTRDAAAGTPVLVVH
ncbi:MAG: hypothetical protein QHI48_07440, partial [Bacteroidota bacterium]|nr:hypothetical protein [Bacteroidota bacterium]